MSKLRYYFDARKGATEAYAKSAFKQMMYDGTTLTANGAKVFDAIWGNIGLRVSLFPDNNTEAERTDAINDFKTYLSNTGNSFFNFIKAK